MVDTSLVTLVTVNLVPTAFLLLEEKPWQRDTLLPPLEGYVFIRVYTCVSVWTIALKISNVLIRKLVGLK